MFTTIQVTSSDGIIVNIPVAERSGAAIALTRQQLQRIADRKTAQELLAEGDFFLVEPQVTDLPAPPVRKPSWRETARVIQGGKA